MPGVNIQGRSIRRAKLNHFIPLFGNFTQGLNKQEPKNMRRESYRHLWFWWPNCVLHYRNQLVAGKFWLCEGNESTFACRLMLPYQGHLFCALGRYSQQCNDWGILPRCKVLEKLKGINNYLAEKTDHSHSFVS